MLACKVKCVFVCKFNVLEGFVLGMFLRKTLASNGEPVFDGGSNSKSLLLDPDSRGSTPEIKC
ncbi:hypothetical protein DID77_01510, partial [Candidatus Marinamargulisbacteria bacterium SCGC AG-439-L15]